MNKRKALGLALGVTLTSLSWACSNDSLAPFEPEIDSEIDSFQLQATDVANVTGNFAFDWINSGFEADVDHSTSTLAGEARLIVRDATGTTVYERALSPSLNERTGVGQSGVWTVTLALTGYSGTLNFRLQKP